MCWIGASLAEALAYIHDRGLVHFDLKPSNVLITSEGQPLLLDFHLAGPPLHPGDPSPSQFGGTALYMSPEQEVVCEAFREGRAVPQLLDGRSDIFSLGLVLRDLLAGPSSGLLQGRMGSPASLKVSPGLRSIINKCLQERPEDRYPDPTMLAADLRRHAADLPLRGARNTSLLERYRKWRRRHPYHSWIATGVMAILAGSLLATIAVADRVRLGFEKMDEATLALTGDHFADAARASAEGLHAIGSIPWCGTLRSALDDQASQARRGLVAAEVERAADLARLNFDEQSMEAGVAAIVLGRLDRLLQRIAEDHKLLALEGPGTSSDLGIRSDLIDIAIFGARIRFHLAPATGVDGIERELRDLENRFGADLVVACERKRLHEKNPTRWPDWPALLASARTSRECLGLGRMLFAAGCHQEAADLLQRALAEQQANLWLHYALGQCYLKNHRYAEALAEFGACVALSPETPECYINRAICYGRLGYQQAAGRDRARAQQLRGSQLSGGPKR